MIREHSSRSVRRVQRRPAEARHEAEVLACPHDNVQSIRSEASLMSATARPFRLHVQDSAIDDLRERLARTRFPDQAPGEPWGPGRLSIPDAGVKVPMGYAAFPRELLRPPRSVAEKIYTDIRRWTAMPKGDISPRWSRPKLWHTKLPSSFVPCGRRRRFGSADCSKSLAAWHRYPD